MGINPLLIGHHLLIIMAIYFYCALRLDDSSQMRTLQA